MENSKTEVLLWINTLLSTNFTKIEQLGNGVAYCKLLHLLDPTSINAIKIINKTKNQIDHISNLKLLQAAFQKLHIKKTFDIDKVSKCSFHENYDLAIFLKKHYTLKNKENMPELATLNTSIIESQQQSIYQPIYQPSPLQQIAEIISSNETSDNKVIMVANILTKNGVQVQLQENIFKKPENYQSEIFKTDSKRQQQIVEQEQKANMLCETPEEMLLDPNDLQQSSSKLIMSLQSQKKKETPQFFESPYNLADFIRSESKQQQQYMQQYSMQKQLQMQNNIEYQSPFREQVYSEAKNQFYSCKGAIIEE